MIELAHNCAVLGIPVDTGRLFGEAPGNYELALRMVVDRVSETNRREAEKAEQAARR